MAVDWSRAAGTLAVEPAPDRPELLAPSVLSAVSALAPEDAVLVGVAEIDPEFADTAEFCAEYGSPLELSANCVIVGGKRGGEVRYAACLVPANARADVNGVVKRRLDLRKASFAAMDEAVRFTSMEYGGITPFGLPAEWPLLVDAAVASAPSLVVGSGLRRSKIIAPGAVLSRLPTAEVLDDLACPVN